MRNLINGIATLGFIAAFTATALFAGKCDYEADVMMSNRNYVTEAIVTGFDYGTGEYSAKDAAGHSYTFKRNGGEIREGKIYNLLVDNNGTMGFADDIVLDAK